MPIRKRKPINEYFEIKKRRCDYPTLQSENFYHDLLNLGKLYKLSRPDINDMSDEVDFSHIFNTVKWAKYNQTEKSNIMEYINSGKCYKLFEKVLKTLNITEVQIKNDIYEIYTFIDTYADFIESNDTQDLCSCFTRMNLN